MIFSGERIVKRDKLLEAFKTFKPVRFQLKVAINKYFIENNYRIDIFKSDLRNTIHFKKHGILKAIVKEARMYFEIFTYSGVREILRQFRYYKHIENSV